MKRLKREKRNLWRIMKMTTKEMREYLNVSRAEFSRRYNIPVRTLENWESGKSQCPDYVEQLLERAVKEDVEKESR